MSINTRDEPKVRFEPWMFGHLTNGQTHSAEVEWYGTITTAIIRHSFLLSMVKDGTTSS